MSQAPRNGKQAQNANSSNVHRATSSQGPQRVVVTGPTQPPNTTPTSQWLAYSEYRPSTGSATPYAQVAYHHPPTPIPYRVQSSETTWPYAFPQSSQDQPQNASSVHLAVPCPVPHRVPGAGPGEWYEFRPNASEPSAVPENDDSQSSSQPQTLESTLDAVQVPELTTGLPPGVTGWDRLRAAQDEARRAFNATSTGVVPSSTFRRNEGDTSSHSGDSRQSRGTPPENRVGFMNPGYQPTRRPRGNERSHRPREETPPPPYTP